MPYRCIASLISRADRVVRAEIQVFRKRSCGAGQQVDSSGTWSLIPPSTVAKDAQCSQVRGLVRTASRERHDVVDLEFNTPGAAYEAAMSVAGHHRLARPLPRPTAPTASGDVLLVAGAPPESDARSATGLRGERTTVETTQHSPRPPLSPFPERPNAAPDGRWVGCIAEEHVAEAATRTAEKARAIGNRAVGLSEPPVMHAPAHG